MALAPRLLPKFVYAVDAGIEIAEDFMELAAFNLMGLSSRWAMKPMVARMSWIRISRSMSGDSDNSVVAASVLSELLAPSMELTSVLGAIGGRVLQRLLAIFPLIAGSRPARFDQPLRAVIGTTFASASRPSMAAANSRPHNSIAFTCSGQRLARW